MIEAALLGFAFLISAAFATTIVPSLPVPLAYAPLMMAAGLLVMHRAGAVLGVIWIILSGILLSVDGGLVPSLVAAALGAVLAERVFAARSVYALLGLGIATGSAAGLMQILLAVGASLTGATVHVVNVVAMVCWQIVLLVGLLYIGFITLHLSRRFLTTLFFIR